MSNIIDYYLDIYDNHITVGDFNLEPSYTLRIVTTTSIW